MASVSRRSFIGVLVPWALGCFASNSAQQARLSGSTGAFAPAQAADTSPSMRGPDPHLVSRLADLEAKLMSAPRASGAFDASALEARIEKVAQIAQERADRVERFLMTRVDDIETQMISAPSAPMPMRSSEIADLDLKLHELSAQFEEMKYTPAPAAPRASVAMPDEFARLAERVSDLEISVMELRIDAPSAGPIEKLDIERRIVEIEGRHAEIIGTLRNLLALLSATDGRRATG